MLVDNHQRWLDRNSALTLPGSSLPLAPLLRHRGRRRMRWGVSFQNVPSSIGKDSPRCLLLMARTGGLFRNNAQAIHKHLLRAFRGEDLPSIMKDNGRLAKTRPGMLTAIDTDQLLFSFQADLDQAHIVLFLEWPQSQDRAKDRCRFDTDEHCCMHTAGHCFTRRSDDVQVHRMFI